MRTSLAILGCTLLLLARGYTQDTVRVHTTDVAAKAMSEAVPMLKERGIDLRLNAQGGSSVGIAAVATEDVDVALTVRRVTPQERAQYPEKRFIEDVVAYQALAIIVPADVWNSGVRSITREQMTAIYEGRLKNWKELGGEDREVKFYNPDMGIGIWEPFVTWLYGDSRKAALGDRFEKIHSATEARDSVEFNAGSVSVAPPFVTKDGGVFALGLKEGEGQPVSPVLEAMVEERYPLSRPIVAIVSQRPTGHVRRFLEFLRSKEGQEILGKNGLVPAGVTFTGE